MHEPDELKGAWSKAFAADRPTVLDVHTDPDFPPIPPHATFEQVKDAAKAMLSGDEDALGVLRTGIKQKVQEFLPNLASKTMSASRSARPSATSARAGSSACRLARKGGQRGTVGVR